MKSMNITLYSRSMKQRKLLCDRVRLSLKKIKLGRGVTNSHKFISLQHALNNQSSEHNNICSWRRRYFHLRALLILGEKGEKWPSDMDHSAFMKTLKIKL